jgi:hypothetical protein
MLALAAFACARGTQNRTFSEAEFRFELPAKWQTMAELWNSYQLQEDYYGLGAAEVVALTSVQKRGEFGIWFSVAKKPLKGATLDELVETTYAQAIPEISDLQQSTTTLDGKPALALRYRRPWGEPWWQFYDVWVRKDSIAYLLSFHALALEEYQADIELILNSFSFQP